MDTTTLNVEYLTKLGACSNLIKFIKRNNLHHFPVSRIDEIRGDHDSWIAWIKATLTVAREFDVNGNVVYEKDSYGYERWSEYDTNGNRIHVKDCDGYECWTEYDANGNWIKQKYYNGMERYSNVEYYPSGQLKQYGNMILPDLNVA